MTLRRALFGFIVASCLFLLVELLDAHGNVENSIIWVPIAAASLAAAAGLVAFLQWRARPWRLALQGVSVLLIAAGLLGFFLHRDGAFSLSLEARGSVPIERGGPPLYVSSFPVTTGGQAVDNEEGEEGEGGGEGEGEEDEGGPPPLAPLSLAGVGVLGLMAASLKGEEAGEA